MYKRILIAGLMLVALASCSQSNEKAEPKPMPSAEIVNKYVDTVTTAKPKAEAAKDVLEGKQSEEAQAIKALDK